MGERSKIYRIGYWILSFAAVLLLVLIMLTAVIRKKAVFGEFPLYAFTGDSLEILMLPDQSEVWLNRNSKLYISDKFGKNQRNLILEGEAYFEITNHSGQPLHVTVGNNLITVSGSAFNLRHDPDGDVVLVVSRGQAAFSEKKIISNKVICSEGERVEFLASSADIRHMNNSNPNYMSWKTGVLVFEKTPLDEVCAVLSNHFNVQVFSMVTEDFLLTGIFRNETLEEILRTLALIFDIEPKTESGGIILYQSSLGK